MVRAARAQENHTMQFVHALHYAVFLCTCCACDALARSKPYIRMEYFNAAQLVSAKCKMRYTTNSQNIVTLNNSEIQSIRKPRRKLGTMLTQSILKPRRELGTMLIRKPRKTRYHVNPEPSEKTVNPEPKKASEKKIHAQYRGKQS